MKTPREVLLSQHRHVEPKLNRIWYRSLVPRLTGNVFWRELIWPCRRVWVGLACAWALIIAVHLVSSETATRVAGESVPQSRHEMQALVEQRQMLAQMIEPAAESADKHKSSLPGPRSEQVTTTSVG
jgi:hypothetical protein